MRIPYALYNDEDKLALRDLAEFAMKHGPNLDDHPNANVGPLAREIIECLRCNWNGENGYCPFDHCDCGS